MMHSIFVPEDFLPFLNGSIKVDFIASAYKAALKKILYDGIDFDDERGDKMRTFFNLMVTIRKPLENLEELEKMNKKGLFPYNKEFLDSYANQLIYGTMKPELIKKEFIIPKRCGLLGAILNYYNLNKKVKIIYDVKQLTDVDLGFIYTYFERLRKRWSRLSKHPFQSLEGYEVTDSEYIDQIAEVIKILNKNKNTRRAVCTTWIPSVDLRKEECPCLNWLVFYNTNGKLNLSTGFRSHDIGGAVVENWYGLARLLEYVALRTGLEIGSLTTISINAHYNKLFEEDIKRVLKES